MLMADVLFSSLVSYSPLSYNVASSHTEVLAVPTYLMLVRVPVSLHMPLILPKPPVLLSLMSQVKDHIF